MLVKGTEDQIKKIAVNAINASIPMGLGFIHYKNKDYSIGDIQLSDGGIYLDYFDGRMVKLTIRRKDDCWELPDRTPQSDYQSWSHVYPTYKDLAMSSGCEIIY